MVEHPHDYLAQLRDADPVHHIDGTNAYLVSRLDLIHEVVAKPEIYSSHSGEFLHLDASGEPGLRSPSEAPAGGERFAGVLATVDPPDHTRQRRVLSRVLSTGAISAQETGFRSLLDATLDGCLAAGHVEWMSQVAEPLPMVMVARILGLPDVTAPALKASGYASVELISGFVPDDRRAELGEAMADMGPVIEAYMAARAATDPDLSTVIGVCAVAVAQGELDDLEAFSMFALLLAAGGESTTSLLGTGVRILAERPDLQERLRQAPDLIPAFVEEACRVDPPFKGHYRVVRTETELGGVPLPAGARLVLSWPAANRDPAFYPRADDVDIDRPNPRNHPGFGWGIHLCIGAPLARLEARVALEQLLARTSSFALATTPAELRHHKSLMVRRLVELPLALTT